MIPVAIGVAALGLLLLVGVVTYNTIVRASNKVDEGWSDVDVQLRRRHDLVPNLVETVRAYAAHEATLLTAATADRDAARRATGAAEASPAESALTEHVGGLMALAEAYPDLKASENFSDLQLELADVENEIAAARNIYNANVRRYNNKVQAFPTLVLAKPAGFSPRPMFTADPQDRQIAEVEIPR